MCAVHVEDDCASSFAATLPVQSSSREVPWRTGADRGDRESGVYVEWR